MTLKEQMDALVLDLVREGIHLSEGVGDIRINPKLRELGRLAAQDERERDIAYATFALGRFVQYSLDGGQREESLHGFMQAYLNLTAAQDGREPLDRRELRSRIAAAPPADPPGSDSGWPSWLSGYETLRAYLRAQRRCRCSAAPHDPAAESGEPCEP